MASYGPQLFPGSLALGSTAPGWINIGSANFVVSSAGFGETSPTASHIALFTGLGPLTDQMVTLTQTAYASVSVNNSSHSFMLRSNLAGTSSLLVQFEFIESAGGTPYPICTLYNFTGGSYTQIGCTLKILGPASGVSSGPMSASVIGNRVGFTYQGNYYCPQDWLATGFTAGYPGIQNDQSGTPPGVGVTTVCTISNNPTPIPTQMTEIATQPLISGTGTYDGVTGTATSPFNPQYDPVTSQWVFPIGINKGADVYGGIYTTVNFQSLNYVTGSLLTPQGSDTILEPIVIMRMPNTAQWGPAAGQYLMTGLHYATSSPVFVTSIWVSPSLTGFQSAGPIDNLIPVGAVGSGDHNGQADQFGIINPVTGNFEMWYTGLDNSLPTPLYRSIMMAYSTSFATNYTTWTRAGILLTGSSYDGQGNDLGAASVKYGLGPDGSANARILCYDGASIDGFRLMYWAWAKQTSPGVWGPFIKMGPLNYQKLASSYGTVTVFGGCWLPQIFDRGDGNGPQQYIVFNGTKSQVTGVLTDGAIGMGYIPQFTTLPKFASMFTV